MAISRLLNRPRNTPNRGPPDMAACRYPACASRTSDAKRCPGRPNVNRPRSSRMGCARDIGRVRVGNTADKCGALSGSAATVGRHPTRLRGIGYFSPPPPAAAGRPARAMVGGRLRLRLRFQGFACAMLVPVRQFLFQFRDTRCRAALRSLATALIALCR